MVDVTYQEDCPECFGAPIDGGVSSCCGGQFAEPGWPDNDICSTCGEHSEPYECITCEGVGFFQKKLKLPKSIIKILKKNVEDNRLGDTKDE